MDCADIQKKPAQSARPSARSASPPPHVVGQIVEMGFSPAQAREALSSTSTGVDVQGALESLLADQGRGQAQFDEAGDLQGSDDEDRVLRERERREQEEAERRRRRRAGPSRASVKPRTREEIEQSRSSTPGARGEYADQADKIIAQASEIGQNMFTKGMSLWNQGKERAMKAYEEQRRAMEAENGGKQRGKEPVRDGRPRWMVDAEEAAANDEQVGDHSRGGGFKDSDDEDVPAAKPRARPQREAQPQPRRSASPPQADLLFGQDTPAAESKPKPSSYQPASRRGPARQAPSKAAPTPLTKRTLVPATPSQVQSASSLKVQGNEHFKLGRFPEAEKAYSSAISSLPEGHILLVNLYNNRAATRLKLGEAGSSAEDSTAVIEIVGLSYHPSREESLPAELAAEVKLGEALVKAVTKRAQA